MSFQGGFGEAFGGPLGRVESPKEPSEAPQKEEKKRERDDADHAKATLRRMYETGEWSDLTIEAGGKEFKVHKSVVCSACPFVEAACTKGFRETHTNRIKLPERAVTVEAMLQHFYAVLWWNTTLFATKPTGADVMYAKDLIDLRTAADKYDIESLAAVTDSRWAELISLFKVPDFVASIGRRVFDAEGDFLEDMRAGAVALAAKYLTAIVQDQRAFDSLRGSKEYLRRTILKAQGV